MRRLLREPLVHFAALGAVLFAAYAALGRGAPVAGAHAPVRIGEGDVAWLRETWSRQRNREPSPAELRGLVASYIREEVLAREARAMGLDEKDTVVRRRLAQKLEFLLQDAWRLAEPTEDDLRRFHAAHPESFREPSRISFTQVFFAREKRKDAAADAAAALARLARGDADAASLGDRTLLDADVHDAVETAVAAQFGDGFAREVFASAPGAWRGPVESAYGLHLVRVDALTPGKQLDLADVRPRLVELWRAAREREQEDRFLAALLTKYDVVVDESVRALVGPVTAAGPATPPAVGGDAR